MPEVEFFGEKLTLVDKPPKYALTKYARDVVAVDLVAGDGETEMRAQAAILGLAEASIAPSDRGKFDRICQRNDAGLDDFDIIIEAMMKNVAEVAADRPTERSSDSSDGPSVMPQKSERTSADKVTELFPGRPDRQNGILDILSEKAV